MLSDVEEGDDLMLTGLFFIFICFIWETNTYEINKQQINKIK